MESFVTPCASVYLLV